MQEAFKDRFSNHASEYRLYRPRYPEALFSYLASLAPEREAAWDCATGNGQAAVCLARHFKQVYATDASAGQITHAIQKNNIRYAVSPAHKTSLPIISSITQIKQMASVSDTIHASCLLILLTMPPGYFLPGASGFCFQTVSSPRPPYRSIAGTKNLQAA